MLSTYFFVIIPDQVSEVTNLLVGLMGWVVVVIIFAVNGILRIPALYCINFCRIRFAGRSIQGSRFIPLNS